MAFQVKKAQEKRVVLEVELPENENEVKKYEYLVPRVKQYSVLKAQRIRAQYSVKDGEAISGSYLVVGILDGVEALNGAPSIEDLLNELDVESANGLTSEIIRLATASTAALVSEGHDIREG